MDKNVRNALLASLLVVLITIFISYRSRQNLKQENDVTEIFSSFFSQDNILVNINYNIWTPQNYVANINDDINKIFMEKGYSVDVLFSSTDNADKIFYQEEKGKYNFNRELKNYLNNIVSNDPSFSNSIYIAININTDLKYDRYKIQENNRFGNRPESKEWYFIAGECNVYTHIILAKGNVVYKDYFFVSKSSDLTIPSNIDSPMSDFIRDRNINTALNSIYWESRLTTFLDTLK